MLFAILYCATQSFLVSYVEVRNLNVNRPVLSGLYCYHICVAMHNEEFV